MHLLPPPAAIQPLGNQNALTGGILTCTHMAVLLSSFSHCTWKDSLFNTHPSRMHFLQFMGMMRPPAPPKVHSVCQVKTRTLQDLEESDASS